MATTLFNVEKTSEGKETIAYDEFLGPAIIRSIQKNEYRQLSTTPIIK